MDSTSGSSAETSLSVSISPLCLSHYCLKLGTYTYCEATNQLLVWASYPYYYIKTHRGVHSHMHNTHILGRSPYTVHKMKSYPCPLQCGTGEKLQKSTRKIPWPRAAADSAAGTFRYSEHSLLFWLNSLLHIETYLSPLFFLLTCLIFQLYVHPLFKLQLPLLLFLSVQLIPLNSILYPPKKQRCHL